MEQWGRMDGGAFGGNGQSTLKIIAVIAGDTESATNQLSELFVSLRVDHRLHTPPSFAFAALGVDR